MTLAAGRRLGPYEVLGPLGAGGMGEVYRARDARLGREVAVKVLPAELAADRERLERFEQEARAASALSHPNIVVVHDVGRDGEVSYIAMEVAPGRSLRERMASGPMPLRQVLAIGAQIADGLARAHAGGIVHRDLKPENVMVSDEGLVKILDFGLAKALPAPEGELTSAPTAAMPAAPTRPGFIMGTVGYMSPEQAAGREVDHRSDQFALGAILYEMTTGRRAFAAETVAQTLAAVIERDPEPIGSIRPDAPPPLTWLVERCLAKTASERYESTRDLARELANLRDRVSAGTAAAVPAARRAPPLRGAAAAWAVAGVLLVALAGSLWTRLRSTAPAPAPPIQFSLAPPDGTGFMSGEVSTKTAISPDGRSLAVVATSQGRRAIYVRPLGSRAYRMLAGTEGGQSPFWSPDGLSLAFFADGKLKRIDLAGGPPRVICDSSFEGTGSWSKEGEILFAEAAPGREGIHSVAVSTGQRRRVLAPDAARGENQLFWPDFLPDGRHFIYVALQTGDKPEHWLCIGSLDQGRAERLGPVDSRASYAAPGELLFVQGGTLVARPFDAAKRRFTGEARPVVESLYAFWGPANAGFSASSNGTLAYEEGTVPTRVVWLDRSGAEAQPFGTFEQVEFVRLSPDGRQASYSLADPKTGTADVWVADASGAGALRMTSEPFDEKYPIWSADGRSLLYRSDRNGPPDVYTIPVGGGAAKPLLELPGVETPEDVSPGGDSLLYTESDRTTGLDIWIAPLKGEGKPSPFLRTRFDEDEPRFSPDGRWIAYSSDESGESEVYVAGGDGTGRSRVSRSGGFSPRWRRDGKELFFRASGGRFLAAPVSWDGSPRIGAPVELFRTAGVFAYDVASDGQRFLVSERIHPPAPPITVVVNWPALLGATVDSPR